MLKFRKKLAQYQEYFYMVFILSMVGLISAGLNSEDKLYLIIFGAATLFLLLKMAVTDFSRKEILWMILLTLLLGANFVQNREKTVIMSAMGIFGAKNVSLEKVFKYSLWLKIALTALTFLGIVTGIYENESVLLPKSGEQILLYCYGYQHPNAAFANIFLIFVFAVIVWKDRLKRYAYAGFTAVLLAAYALFVCRTGLLVWIALLMLAAGYKISSMWKWEKKYLTVLLFIPVTLALLTFILPLIGMRNNDFFLVINNLLNGRIWHLLRFWWGLGVFLLGNSYREPFDSSYFHLVYNYGWILSAICFFAYLNTMWHCIKKDRHYEVIVLAVMAVYGFMEHWPLSIGWNLPLLFLSLVLFRREESPKEL